MVKLDTATIQQKFHNFSILCPLLLIIFIKDLCDLVKTTLDKTGCYADDTPILLKEKETSNLNIIAKYIMSNVQNWSNGNKIYLNLSKTNYIVFLNKKLLHILNFGCLSRYLSMFFTLTNYAKRSVYISIIEY